MHENFLGLQLMNATTYEEGEKLFEMDNINMN